MTAVAGVGGKRIARNASILLVAQIASRVLAIVYIAALARYVGTEGIGTISTATALAGLLVLVLAPGLDQFLIREVAADPDKASSYLGNMLCIRVILGIPFLILVVITSNAAGYAPYAIPIIYLYALVYLFDSLGELFTSLFRANQRMEYEAETQVFRDLVNFSLSLLAIYLGFPLIVIVLMSLVAQLSKFALLFLLASRNFVRPTLAVQWRTMRALCFASLTFGGLVVLYTLQNQLGTLVLSWFHPPSTVGIFTAANTLIATLVLVPGTLGVALYPAFSLLHVHAPVDLSQYYSLAFKYLFILGLGFGVGTILIAQPVIMLIYGQAFQDSVMILRILAIFLFTFVTYCNGPLINATGHERFFAVTLTAGVTAYGLLCWALIPWWGPTGAAVALVTAGCATTTLYSVACHRFLKIALPWGMMAKVLIATCGMALVTCAALLLGLNWLVVSATVAPICYLALLTLLGLLNRQELANLAGLRSMA